MLQRQAALCCLFCWMRPTCPACPQVHVPPAAAHPQPLSLNDLAAIGFKYWRQVSAMHQHGTIFQTTNNALNDACLHCAAKDQGKPEEVPPRRQVPPGTLAVFNLRCGEAHAHATAAQCIVVLDRHPQLQPVKPPLAPFRHWQLCHWWDLKARRNACLPPPSTCTGNSKFAGQAVCCSTGAARYAATYHSIRQAKHNPWMMARHCWTCWWATGCATG